MAKDAPPESPKPRFDAGDSESVGERKREANAREARKAAAFATFVSSPGGREWVWDFMAETYIFSNTFTGNSEGFFREGKRNIGLKVLAELTKTHPDVFATMMKENAK